MSQSAKAILICGKLCSGKTTYAEKLCEEGGAVLLSVDEMILALFPHEIGENHDVYTEKAKKYLYDKSLDIIKSGTNVILDSGFWKKEEREFAKKFYKTRNIEVELHYVDVSDETWKERIDSRNREVLSEKTNAYYVDNGLYEKFSSIFELPDKSEIDVWIKTKGE